MTNILVTGGTGFLGKRLSLTLKAKDYTVTVLGRDKQIGQELNNHGIKFIPCDLTHEHKVIQACKGMDYVFHCGALSSSWGAYDLFYKANVLGTQHIIQGCKKYRVKRLIYVSTPSVYTANQDRIAVKETDQLPEKKVNHYAATKYMAEQYVQAASKEGLPVISIRPRAIFGPGDPNILPRLLEANEQKRLPFIRNGNALMDVTYVDNVVHALLLCMTSSEDTIGEVYNITNGEPMTFKALVEQFFSRLGEEMYPKQIPFCLAYSLATLLELGGKVTNRKEEPLLTRTTALMLGRSLTLDITKAKSELSYEPLYTVADGIEAYVKYIRNK